MHPGIFLILFVIHLVQVQVHAAFNQATNENNTWNGNYVKPNRAGTFCYVPAANQTNATFCSGGHSQSPSFQNVLEIHLNLTEGWSIAYYNSDNKPLGNQNYSVTPNTGTIQCLSGQAGDKSYQTMCMGVDSDNNIDEAGSYCQVKVGQIYVSDGCYTAMPNTTTSSTAGGPTSTSSNPSSSSPLVTNPIGTVVVPSILGILSLFGVFSVAYCTNPWCRQQTNKRCCCMCGRLANKKKKAMKYAVLDEVELDEDPNGSMNYESTSAGHSSRSAQLVETRSMSTRNDEDTSFNFVGDHQTGSPKGKYSP